MDRFGVNQASSIVVKRPSTPCDGKTAFGFYLELETKVRVASLSLSFKSSIQKSWIENCFVGKMQKSNAVKTLV